MVPDKICGLPLLFIALYASLFSLATHAITTNPFQATSCVPEQLCSQIPVHSSGLVEDYCNKQQWLVKGHCCFNSTEQSLVGLNMEDCNITTLNGVLKNFTSLQILSLLSNPIKNMTKEDFTGLRHLEILYIPSANSCPGDSHAWGTVSIESYGLKCSDQRDPCVYLNVSCTDAGDCHHLGPGIAKCECLDGFHGYKCLRHGEFPWQLFGSCIGLSTVFLSVCLWCTQRKHVKVD